jgi:hypothetical protein
MVGAYHSTSVRQPQGTGDQFPHPKNVGDKGKLRSSLIQYFFALGKMYTINKILDCYAGTFPDHRSPFHVLA